MQSILIVDDLESIHEMLDAVIQPIGYNTAFATDGEIALQKIREERYDIVLTDINMKPMDGLSLLAAIKEADPEAIVIMMSGYANIDNATQALKLGAFDYLTKPFKVDQLMNSIARAAAERKKRRQSGSAASAQNSLLLSGDSETAKSFNERLSRAAKLPTPLLITGDTGTQKASIAALVHARSDSAGEPFVTVDAKKADSSELPGLLFDSEGAPSETVRSAQNGFLFLANIDAIPRELQATLGTLIRDLKGDIRVVCSSSRDLEQLVEEGQFEDGLYFRIANNALHVPALRDRTEDIPAIALAYFAQNHLPFNALGEGAAALMQGYRWPGNYTELQEVLAAAAEVGEGQTIREADLPEKLRDISSWPSLEDYLAEQAERYKQAVLKACQGDQGKAASILGTAP
ncbi:sigma-54-dependent Fis family transcriptional regulator [Pelagicoccus sp. NFK12]|uniref:Sigma-54-dependent Fis family transcriptional regulator n=1 Tax=Pelagicoccus enzymogenes TaxID=2773457 RepID=A0A927F9Z3_9BACT|nr:response regulator [Pelagicoccus enzymogenes]MBD5781044.1 sigma-54-dependent Fis family transcriptional regulator [Pelagicoccus enzymogenes]